MLLRLATALMLACGPLMAQGLSLGTPVTGTVQSPVLVIDIDQAFAQSAFGRRVAAELERDGQALAEENREIEAELVAEERELTDIRGTMEAAQFRQLADAFNAKVERLRREQDDKARTLGARSDALRRVFVEAARPVLQTIMQEAGAGVILEARTVFLVAGSVNVTELAIERINAVVGDGSALEARAADVARDAADQAAPDPESTDSAD